MLDRSSKRTPPLWRWVGLAVSGEEGRARTSLAPINAARSLAEPLLRGGKMTAEVVILNKMAAAMAADSKGTIRVAGVVKTHDTLNKLFTLSKYHPVGVMIYGNAEVMGVPWETIIKLYRDKLRDVSFPKLNGHAHDFVFSLVNDYKSPRHQQKETVYWTARDFFDRVLDRRDGLTHDAHAAGPSVSDDEAISAAHTIWAHAVERQQLLYTFRHIDAPTLGDMYAEELLSAFSSIFDEDRAAAKIKDKLIKTACEALRKAQFSESASGLVFAGFGDREIFPSMKAYMIDGIVADKMRGRIIEKTVVSSDLTASIRPFAQNEMVVRFMEGIDPDYRRYLQSAIYVLANDLVSTVIDFVRKGKV